MELRKLTKRGLELFQAYLQALRSGEPADFPEDLKEDPALAVPCPDLGVVEDRRFQSRLEIGRYLNEVFAGVPFRRIGEDVGLWTWLSVFFFDVVCPAGTGGSRNPGADDRHVLNPSPMRSPRHLLWGPYLVYKLHGEKAGVLLCSAPHRENLFYSEIAYRQNLLANPAVVEALSLLYLKRGRKLRPKPKSAVGRNQPGSLKRFVDLVQQLDVNFDLFSTDAETLVRLLPQEFNRWKPRRLRSPSST